LTTPDAKVFLEIVRPSLLIVLGAALLLRIALALNTSSLGAHIVDEQHYVELASNLYQGVGFAWSQDHPTSIRPPLYPFFMASVWAVVGAQSLQAVRWAQIPLALLSILLLYFIGRRWFDHRTALLAAAAFAVYPSLLFTGVLLLTETLFTALLLLFVLCFALLEERRSLTLAAGTGIALGLAALTRSILWPFLLILVAVMWVTLRSERRRRFALVAAAVLGYAVIVGPWSVRNTSLQGTFTVVDTMGGLNLLMGNYAHTPEDRMWDAISMTGEKYWAAGLPPTAPDGGRWTEGKKEKWAQRQAIAFMTDHPLTTLRRAVLKFADFWGLERDFVAGVQRGYYAPPTWFAITGAAGVTVAYVITALLASLGIFLAPPGRSAHVFLLVLVLFVCGVHTVVFGHSRYHLPLIPILLLYGASAVTSGQWRGLLTRRPPALLATGTIVVLCLIWVRELISRDWDRIRQLMAG
jgi:4-amino-4-deoxy-L-arabinose transferase-like glycosyltransferase